MIKPPLIALLLASSIAIPFFKGNAQSVSVQDAADRATTGRSKIIPRIEAALAEGDKAYQEKHYDVATTQYQTACDLLPEASLTHDLRTRALDGFGQASVRLAEQYIVEGRFADAEAVVKTVLDPKYNPRYKPAAELLAHLEEPGYYNKNVGSGFGFHPVSEIRNLFAEAQGFYDAGKYDPAYKCYDQILNLDPYNIAARRGEEKMIAAKLKYGPVEHSWPTPIKYGSEIVRIGGAGAPRDTEYIQNKLNHIIIPKIEFKEVTAREVIDFLKKKSVELDTTETDPARKGVNIVLRDLPALKDAVPAGPPGSPPLPTLATGALGGVMALSIPPADAKMTLTLTNVSLSEALRYITSLAGLKMKIDPYAVVIVPL